MTHELAPLALAALTFVVAAGAGAFPIWHEAFENESALGWITGLAAGFLLSSALVVVIPEGYDLVLEHAGGHGGEHVAPRLLGMSAPMAAGLAVLLGFLGMMLLEAYGIGHDVHGHEHGHGTGHEEAAHTHVAHHHGSNPLTVVLGLTCHAATDGLAIGAALAVGRLSLTLPVLLGVVIHKLPEAFSLGVYTRQLRRDRRRSLVDLALYSAATPVLLLSTWAVLGDVQESWIGLAILLSGGTFLYVATVDVLPQVHRQSSARAVLAQVATGALLTIGLLVTLDATGWMEHPH